MLKWLPAVLCCGVVVGWAITSAAVQGRWAAEQQKEGGSPRESQTDQLWDEVQRLWEEGKILKIVSVVERIVQLDPKDVQAWIFLGWHQAYNLSVEKDLGLDEREQIRKGIAAFKRGIKTLPQAAELRWELGMAYYDRLGDVRSAAAVFEETLRLVDAGKLVLMDPDEQRPLKEWRRFLMRTLAHVYERTPDLDRALSIYQRMIRDYPNEDVARFTSNYITKDYAKAWAHYKAGRYQEAVAAADSQLAERPIFIGLYLKAYSHIRLQEWQKAREALSRILHKNLRERVALERLKWVEEQMQARGLLPKSGEATRPR